jgi:hypothetical protein
VNTLEKSKAVESGPIKLRFYVAGGGLFTRQALANLDLFIGELGEERSIEKEIVDVTDSPEQTLREGVFTTPTLLVTLSSGQLRFIGDLSQRDSILRALKSSLSASVQSG